MELSRLKWLYLIVLSVVWGSSFILIKKALLGLTPIEVGAFRILLASLFLLIIGFKKLKTISRYQWKWIFIAGFIGTFIPAFFFAFAQTQIDSAITSILNATTPLMTLIFGALLFSIGFTKQQLLGVIIGLLGCFLLIWQGADVNPNQNYWYVLFVIVATICYAMNVNILKTRLESLSALAISAGCFLVLMIPAVTILIFSDFLKKDFSNPVILEALGFLSLLSIIGTALALLLFNKLIKISTPVFSSSVTYTIPVVALFWGVIDGERFTVWQGLATFVIILGVIMANRKRKRKQKTAPV